MAGPTGYDTEALFAVPVGSTLCQEQQASGDLLVIDPFAHMPDEMLGG